jgi:hypothetical protein
MESCLAAQKYILYFKGPWYFKKRKKPAEMLSGMALLFKYTLHISVPAALYLSTGTQGRYWYLPGCPSTLTFYHPKPPSFHLTSIIPGCWYKGFKSPPAPFVILFYVACRTQHQTPISNQQLCSKVCHSPVSGLLKRNL